MEPAPFWRVVTISLDRVQVVHKSHILSGTIDESRVEAAMSNLRQQSIFLTKAEDGTFLAASIDSPRFCVGAATQREALEKAQRARHYYDSVKDKTRLAPARETRVISPVYEEKELCVAE